MATFRFGLVSHASTGPVLLPAGCAKISTTTGGNAGLNSTLTLRGGVLVDCWGV